MKHSLRSLERAARHAGLLSDATLPAVIARYLDLVCQKRQDYWTTCVDSERLQPRRLWQSFDQLLGRGQAPATTDIDASALHHFFDNKVNGVRYATAGAPLPQFSAMKLEAIVPFTPFAGL